MSRFVPTIVSRDRTLPIKGREGPEGEPQRSSISSARQGEWQTGYEASLTAEQWLHLCSFLKMDLVALLQLSGPELLKATVDEIKRRDLRKRGYQV
jgi:hypothetical protein